MGVHTVKLLSIESVEQPVMLSFFEGVTRASAAVAVAADTTWDHLSNFTVCQSKPH